MKTIGMLGGMSWESTVPYYRIVNEVVRERLGGLHSAKVLLHSVDLKRSRRARPRGAGMTARKSSRAPHRGWRRPARIFW